MPVAPKLLSKQKLSMLQFSVQKTHTYHKKNLYFRVCKAALTFSYQHFNLGC